MTELLSDREKGTDGPWWVRERKQDDEIVDCFVAAKDVNGFPYDAEILGDDEYRDNIKRKVADASRIARLPTSKPPSSTR
jgi:hypothetical protein